MQDSQYANWKLNLAMLWFSQLLVMAGYSAMIPFIPLFIKEDLGIVSESSLAFYVSMFNFFGTMGYVLCCPLWGMLADRVGMKPMLLRGTFVTAFIFPLMGYVFHPWYLVLLRFLSASCAGTTAASQTMIARTTPDDKQGFAQGVLTTAIWGGAMLGNVIGGFIIYYFNYRWAFWFCGILYFLSGFSILFTHDNMVVKAVQKVRKKSASWLPSFTQSVWLLLCLFLIMGIIRNFEAPYVALKVETLAGKESASYWTGIVSAIVCAGAILSGVFSGYLADKLEPKKMLVPIFIISALALFLQGFSGSLWLFAASRTLLYCAGGGLQPILQKVLSAATPQRKRGKAFGFATAAGGAGVMAAALLSGGAMVGFSLNGVFYAGGALFLLSLPLFLHFLKFTMKEKYFRLHGSRRN